MKLVTTSHPHVRKGSVIERDTERGEKLILLGWAVEVKEKGQGETPVLQNDQQEHKHIVTDNTQKKAEDKNQKQKPKGRPKKK